MATLPNIPDLPTPITPDRPEPIELPVEPDRGIVGTVMSGHRLGRGGMAFHFLANRQFMCAAAFRWPRASASVRNA
ncbi:hypothetical protein ACSFA3_05605 [Variovorax sp. RHLX14]|uniref:hypothetical protein n=1 Tax=Variovorax sp. RHLX14 TaxID=1259731 RepID=UPI003F47F06F